MLESIVTLLLYFQNLFTIIGALINLYQITMKILKIIIMCFIALTACTVDASSSNDIYPYEDFLLGREFCQNFTTFDDKDIQKLLASSKKLDDKDIQKLLAYLKKVNVTHISVLDHFKSFFSSMFTQNLAPSDQMHGDYLYNLSPSSSSCRKNSAPSSSEEPTFTVFTIVVCIIFVLVGAVLFIVGLIIEREITRDPNDDRFTGFIRESGPPRCTLQEVPNRFPLNDHKIPPGPLDFMLWDLGLRDT